MTEAELYEPIMSCLRGSFAAVGKSVHLEIAATKGLSEKVKRAIPMGKEIVFSFLRQHRPDIIGVIEGEGVLNPLVIVEVKAKSLTLDDVYQAKQYKEVLEARGGILVTVHPIPEDLRRLCAQNWDILCSASDSAYKFLAICQFDIAPGKFIDWFRDNPFQREHFWKL
jgi:hypothetical protein